MLLLLCQSRLSPARCVLSTSLPSPAAPPRMREHWPCTISQSNRKRRVSSVSSPLALPAVLPQPGTWTAPGAQTPLDHFHFWRFTLHQALALSLHQLQALPVQAELRPGEELQQRTRDGHKDEEVKAALAKSRLQGGVRLQLRLGAHHVAQGVALEDVVAWCREEVVRRVSGDTRLWAWGRRDQ